MPYPTTVDSGQTPPWIITSEAAVLSSTSSTLATNTVYLFAFELFANISISGVRIRVGSTATGTTDLGIYDVNGNKLVSTGAVSNSSNTTMTNNFSSNYALAPGKYFLAMCVSNNTDTLQRLSGVANMAPATRFRLANNNGSSGVLPSTTGGTTSTTICPMMAGIVVGGLG